MGKSYCSHVCSVCGSSVSHYRPLPDCKDTIIVMGNQDGSSHPDCLGEQTGETIILGLPSGDAVRYIHVVQATNAMRLHVGNGTVRPMAISGMGRLFMSQMDEARVRRIVERYNAQLGDDEGRLNLAAVRRDLASIRAEGHVPSFDRVAQGAGGISVLLPVAPHGVPMAVAIAGLSRTINDNRERFLQLIRAGIRPHLPGGAALRAA